MSVMTVVAVLADNGHTAQGASRPGYLLPTARGAVVSSPKGPGLGHTGWAQGKGPYVAPTVNNNKMAESNAAINHVLARLNKYHTYMG